MPTRRISRRRFLTMAAGLSAAAVAASCQAPSPQAPAAPAAGEPPAAAAPQEVKIAVWAQANEVEHWRVDAPVDAAAAVNKMLKEKGDNRFITVEGLRDDAGWADYKKKFTMAADAGQAPQIVLSGHEDVPTWANAGYIVPFDECHKMYPEYDNIIDSLWFAGQWKGQLWAVPQDTEARPMFFSKTNLKAMGWSEEQVAGLPDKILAGEFTLEDMVALCKEAVAAKIVEPGYGYWHRTSKGGDFMQYYMAYGGRMYDETLDKLVAVQSALEEWYAFQRRIVDEGITPAGYIGTDGSIFHDTVSHGKCLFWNGGVWHWADQATNYVADLGGQDYLFEHVGYALQPAGRKGFKAGTLSHPLVYMITSEKASGSSGYYDLACALLAETSTAEMNTRHAVDSTHLGINKKQAEYEPYASNRLLSETLYMLNYNYYQPNHIMYGAYFDILWDNMVKAENGELKPDEAAKAAVELLKVELPNDVVIE
ncbi:MAG: extracellular solute-binding protein [Chloroflexi bacterium]|nr:extracellular solute-binding protein [Chloroflexota bacterium]